MEQLFSSVCRYTAQGTLECPRQAQVRREGFAQGDAARLTSAIRRMRGFPPNLNPPKDPVQTYLTHNGLRFVQAKTTDTNRLAWYLGAWLSQKGDVVAAALNPGDYGNVYPGASRSGFVLAAGVKADPGRGLRVDKAVGAVDAEALSDALKRRYFRPDGRGVIATLRVMKVSGVKALPGGWYQATGTSGGASYKLLVNLKWRRDQACYESSMAHGLPGQSWDDLAPAAVKATFSGRGEAVAGPTGAPAFKVALRNGTAAQTKLQFLWAIGTPVVYLRAADLEALAPGSVPAVAGGQGLQVALTVTKSNVLTTGDTVIAWRDSAWRRTPAPPHLSGAVLSPPSTAMAKFFAAGPDNSLVLRADLFEQNKEWIASLNARVYQAPNVRDGFYADSPAAVATAFESVAVQNESFCLRYMARQPGLYVCGRVEQDAVYVLVYLRPDYWMYLRLSMQPAYDPAVKAMFLSMDSATYPGQAPLPQELAPLLPPAAPSQTPLWSMNMARYILVPDDTTADALTWLHPPYKTTVRPATGTTDAFYWDDADKAAVCTFWADNYSYRNPAIASYIGFLARQPDVVACGHVDLAGIGYLIYADSDNWVYLRQDWPGESPAPLTPPQPLPAALQPLVSSSAPPRSRDLGRRLAGVFDRQPDGSLRFKAALRVGDHRCYAAAQVPDAFYVDREDSARLCAGLKKARGFDRALVDYLAQHPRLFVCGQALVDGGFSLLAYVDAGTWMFTQYSSGTAAWGAPRVPPIMERPPPELAPLLPPAPSDAGEPLSPNLARLFLRTPDNGLAPRPTLGLPPGLAFVLAWQAPDAFYADAQMTLAVWDFFMSQGASSGKRQAYVDLARRKMFVCGQATATGFTLLLYASETAWIYTGYDSSGSSSFYVVPPQTPASAQLPDALRRLIPSSPLVPTPSPYAARLFTVDDNGDLTFSPLGSGLEWSGYLFHVDPNSPHGFYLDDREEAASLATAFKGWFGRLHSRFPHLPAALDALAAQPRIVVCGTAEAAGISLLIYAGPDNWLLTGATVGSAVVLVRPGVQDGLPQTSPGPQKTPVKPSNQVPKDLELMVKAHGFAFA